MLSFNRIENHINFKLKNPTNSYSLDLCKKYYNKYFLSNNINQLLQNNIISVTQLLNDKQINYNTLEFYSKNNPLYLFSECYADNCPLNRKYNCLCRSFIERKTIEIIKNNYKKNKKITYSSYLPGYFFQDIVILTKMVDIIDKDCIITINLVGNINDYLTIVENKIHNPNANINIINYELYNKNSKIEEWSKLFTYRLIKLLEWFKGIGLKIDLNLYYDYNDFIKECNKNYKLLSDITIGIDYIDDIMNGIYEFKILALCTTKHNGYIISLRTHGLPFFNIKIKFFIEIYINHDPELMLIKYNSFDNMLNKLSEEYNLHKIEIPINKNEFSNYLDKLGEYDKIEKNGKNYILNTIRGHTAIYEDNEFYNINQKKEKIIKNIYKFFSNKKDNCKHMYNLYGCYKCILSIIFYNIKDNILNIVYKITTYIFKIWK